MPLGDRTGPMGQGPMTGRAAGLCAGYDQPGSMNPAVGRGCGFGRGRGFGRGLGFGLGLGRGFRNRFLAAGALGWGWAGNAAATDAAAGVDEKQALKSQAEALQTHLEAVRKRLEQLDVK